MNQYNILIVEDEFINAQFIEKAILKLGHTVVETVETGHEALEVIEKEKIDIIFMDINLEGKMDGITCAKEINQKKTIPIIYTTAFSDSQTIDEATDTNLFGYLIKPYDFNDIEAILKLTIKKNYSKKQRSNEKNTQPFIELDECYHYYIETQTLMKDEKPVELTRKESAVFYYLFKNFNQTVSAEYLNQYVWNNKSISPSTIRDTILRLRKKVPGLSIQTFSGLGYSLEKPS